MVDLPPDSWDVFTNYVLDLVLLVFVWLLVGWVLVWVWIWGM